MIDGFYDKMYHTATHLLLAALQKVISPDIVQKGSNTTSERTQFDFNCNHKLTTEEIAAVEKQVNDWIKADLPVVFDEYDKDYARDVLKAHGQFWDKYPDILKVYTIGDFDNPVSREVCGGPHVEHTGMIGKFKIIKLLLNDIYLAMHRTERPLSLSGAYPTGLMLEFSIIKVYL